MVQKLLLAVLVLTLAAGTARASTRLSVGIFGGSTVPVAQDVDVSSPSLSEAFGPSGGQWGFRAAVKAIPVVTLEPYYSKSSYGDDTQTYNGIEYTRSGFEGNSLGLNAIFGTPDGAGFHFFPYVGFGKFDLDRPGETIDDTGWNFGLGVGYGFAEKFSVQFRPELNMVVTGETSRKFATASLGLSYVIMP
jgi:hypothetical protein